MEGTCRRLISRRGDPSVLMKERGGEREREREREIERVVSKAEHASLCTCRDSNEPRRYIRRLLKPSEVRKILNKIIHKRRMMDVDPRQYENAVSSLFFLGQLLFFNLCFVCDRIG